MVLLLKNKLDNETGQLVSTTIGIIEAQLLSYLKSTNC